MTSYNNAIVTLSSLDIELVLQQKTSWGHWITKAEENLKFEYILAETWRIKGRKTEHRVV